MTEHAYKVNTFPFRLKQLLSFFYPIILEKRPGKYSSSLEITLENGYLVLNSEKANYSFGNLHTLFLRAFSHYHIEKRSIREALVLGFGGGSVAEILLEDLELNLKITGIERDPEVIALYEKYFEDDPEGNIELLEKDALEYVRDSRRSFDLIAIDLFVDITTPPEFAGEEFVNKAVSLLKPGGILFYNRILDTENSRREAELIRSMLRRLPGKASEIELGLGGLTNVMFVFEH